MKYINIRTQETEMYIRIFCTRNYVITYDYLGCSRKTYNCFMMIHDLCWSSTSQEINSIQTKESNTTYIKIVMLLFNWFYLLGVENTHYT